MIVRARPAVWELPFIYKLSILRLIRWQLLSVAAFSLCVVVVSGRYPRLFQSYTVAPFTLLGIALSIFLGFRNNACYERWWEARRQLGALIGLQRSLARFTLALPSVDPTSAEQAVLQQIAYIYALVAHLRDEPMSVTGVEYLSPVALKRPVADVPDRILQSLSRIHATWRATGAVSGVLLCRLDERLSDFAAVQVACERIKGTPVPFAYTLLLHRTAYAFCFLLPFGLASTFRFGTVLLCTLVAYAFFGLDAR